MKRNRTSGLRRARPFPGDQGAWWAFVDLVTTDGRVEDLVAAVAAERGRPITLLEHDLPSGDLSGVWVQLPDKDYVVVATALSAGHRRLVICHEIAHMLLGHKPRSPGGPMLSGALGLPLLMRSCASGSTLPLLGRCGYGDDVEADAELLATLLAARLAERAATAAQVSAHAQDNVSTRLR